MFLNILRISVQMFLNIMVSIESAVVVFSSHKPTRKHEHALLN